MNRVNLKSVHVRSPCAASSRNQRVLYARRGHVVRTQELCDLGEVMRSKDFERNTKKLDIIQLIAS